MADIKLSQVLSMGADAIHLSKRPPPTAPTGYYDWEVSSDPADGRKGHSVVSNLIGSIETLKSKGQFKPDPRTVVRFAPYLIVAAPNAHLGSILGYRAEPNCD